MSQPPFQKFEQLGQYHDQREIHDGDQQQRVDRVVGVVAHEVARERQIPDRHVARDGRFLEQRDELVADRRDDVPQRLRQHDLARRLDAGQPETAPGFHLPLVHGVDAAADQLGHVRAGVDAERDNGNRHTVLCGYHYNVVKDEQQHHHGYYCRRIESLGYLFSNSIFYCCREHHAQQDNG